MKRLHQLFEGDTYVKCAWVSVYLKENDVEDVCDYTNDQFILWRYMNLDQGYELYLINLPLESIFVDFDNEIYFMEYTFY